MEVKISKEELYLLIKKAIKEVFEEEKITFALDKIPFISDSEMADIQNEYRQPTDDNDIAYSENLKIWIGLLISLNLQKSLQMNIIY